MLCLEAGHSSPRDERWLGKGSDLLSVLKLLGYGLSRSGEVALLLWNPWVCEASACLQLEG